VFVNIYPSAPEMNGSWPDTICARGDTIWYSVKPAKIDSLQHNYYVWTFPNGCEIVDSNGINKDSVRVVMNNRSMSVDTISVMSQSWACFGENGAGKVMKRPVVVWDTVIFAMDSIRDILRNEAFGTSPCPDDTIVLALHTPYPMDSIKWLWGESRDALIDTVTDNLQIGSTA